MFFPRIISSIFLCYIFILLIPPGFCRVFVNVLQHSVLDAFRKVLASSPASLEVFRGEGIWDLLFSENFFYFGLCSEEISGEHCNDSRGFMEKLETASCSSTDGQTKASGIEILQMEIISFSEFAATCNGSVHNLVGPLIHLLMFLQTFFFLWIVFGVFCFCSIQMTWIWVLII